MTEDEEGAEGARENAAPTVTVEQVSIDSGAHVLSGRLYQPDNFVPRRAIALHSATGVPQGYYERLARWLAVRRDAAVLTYDYRDFGRSATISPRESDASMADWGASDQSAALTYVCERFPGVSVEVVGHSLGGQYLSFHANASRVERLVAIASGPANWRRHPVRFMPQVLFFWFLGGPILTALAGYLPGRLLGLGADLPRNVYRQWRRWCLSPDFNRRDWGGALPEPDLKAFQGELILVGVEDDEFVPPARVRLQAAMYPSARVVRHLEIRPRDFDLMRIGHLKLASARCMAAWPTLFDEQRLTFESDDPR